MLVYFYVFFAWMVSRSARVPFRMSVELHILSMSYGALLERNAKQKLSCLPFLLLIKYAHIWKFVTCLACRVMTRAPVHAPSSHGQMA